MGRRKIMKRAKLFILVIASLLALSVCASRNVLAADTAGHLQPTITHRHPRDLRLALPVCE